MISGGSLHSGEEVSVTTDCDWLAIKLNLDTLNSNANIYRYYYQYSVQRNASKEQRVAKVTFTAGDAVLEKYFVQRGYTSTFTYSPEWNQIDRQTDVEVTWTDTLAYAYVYPNFGIELKEKPEWVKEVLIYNDDEEYEYEDGSTGIYMRFDVNVKKTSRSGEVVLSDYYGRELVINLTQTGVENNRIVSQLNNFVLGGDRHYDWGYASVMHVRDIMTGDLTVAETGYDGYKYWASNQYMGDNYIYSQFLWYYFRDMVYTINQNLEALDKIDEDVEAEKAVAYAYRALTYLDWAQMYEFLPNEVTSPITAAGNDVTNLTVPILDKPVYHYDTINVPRATREEMAAFILSDLNKAEAGIVSLNDASKELPHLDAVYGLKARLYMWLGDYENARRYARQAIDCNTGHVMTREECLSTTDGFNTPEPWMWASVMEADDDVVRTGILNWTSWMSPEAQYGYSAAGATSMIDAAMYNRMSNSDFRKLMFKAPAGHELESKVSYIDAYVANNLPDYAAIKFRPNDGDAYSYSVGSASAYPIMRIEEMYFIEAEAAAHLNPGEGIALLQGFMKEYRDESYTYNADYDAIDEILFQKRVELWGEGQSFFDYKRLNMSVTRGYEGTNVAADRTFNTNGRPAWMNICIVVLAKRYNIALEGWENPDPSDLYVPQY
ncbi:MAG: RagB/SusD family nutrient uptake outer membrane protein [Bacteroidaceae bacterium]|nr:RagB/SusD family nutrient uptake outer membrane protein [Bacteroidaceae bacterium]